MHWIGRISHIYGGELETFLGTQGHYLFWQVEVEPSAPSTVTISIFIFVPTGALIHVYTMLISFPCSRIRIRDISDYLVPAVPWNSRG
jgi:hypothetical protein